MIAFFAVGALMAMISLSMAVNPSKFAESILTFSRWRWFHVFEVASRLLIGVAFVLLHDDFIYPTFAVGFGYLLIAVAVGLTLAGPARHKRFARLAAERGLRIFRPAGVIGVVLGLLLAYLATLPA